MLLPLLHFNDVYRVGKQKLQNGQTIDVSQFAARVDDLRNTWPKETGGLLLFSGDLFNPSVESSVTRGSHMVPVINIIAPDISLTGNHDFDFGYPHLQKLMADCKFPWILSNVINNQTGKTPEGLQRFITFERGGVKIGVIGLVEKNWISTVPAWPPHFEYQDMEAVAMELSKELRGDKHQCDIILALTHCRLPNDIALAKAIHAHAKTQYIASKHGADILFGGHDHTYYIGRGADAWEGYENDEGELGAEEDDGVRLVKSGTDFRDLSEMIVELEDAPPGSVRRKIVKSLKGRRHQTTPDLPSSSEMTELLSTLLTDISGSMSVPVCYTLEEWDVRSEVIRLDESAFGNWVADVVMHAYDDAINELGDHRGGADGVMLCGGALRGDSRYGPGKITIGDVLEILPFSDPILVIEMDGQSIWDAFESSLSMYPAQEGRFPVISGFWIEWDSRRQPGDRILGIWLTAPDPSVPSSGTATPISRPVTPGLVGGGEAHKARKGEAIPKQKGGKQYKVVTRQYMYEGHDGCEALVGKHCLVDDESGVIMSSILRKFLLGSQYIHEMKKLSADAQTRPNYLDPRTTKTIQRAHRQWESQQLQSSPSSSNLAPPPPGHPSAQDRWHSAISKTLRAQGHSKADIEAALRVCRREHMSAVDGFDGEHARVGHGGEVKTKETKKEEELVVVRPLKDGRLKDIARAQ